MRWMLLIAALLACGREETMMMTPDGGTPPPPPPPPPPNSEVLVRTTMIVPRGTVVEEFDFDAAGTAPSASTRGSMVVVAVRDLSHPERDQAICVRSHPLDGCPTVDYGAFGTTHDNRVTVGSIDLHLYKDRSIAREAEALPPFE